MKPLQIMAKCQIKSWRYRCDRCKCYSFIRNGRSKLEQTWTSVAANPTNQISDLFEICFWVLIVWYLDIISWAPGPPYDDNTLWIPKCWTWILEFRTADLAEHDNGDKWCWCGSDLDDGSNQPIGLARGLINCCQPTPYPLQEPLAVWFVLPMMISMNCEINKQSQSDR